MCFRLSDWHEKIVKVMEMFLNKLIRSISKISAKMLFGIGLDENLKVAAMLYPWFYEYFFHNVGKQS